MTRDTLLDGSDVLDALVNEVGSWEGVSVAEHRFGGVEFVVGRREIGHVHPVSRGRSFADLPFTRKVRDELVAAGLARPHHVLPDSGWVTVPIRTEDELRLAVKLFRLNVDRSWTGSTVRDAFARSGMNRSA